MIKVEEAVIVEGKYDKIKLSSIVDGVIIETNGFGIFKDWERMALIRRLAEKKGIVILTDSDGAGFVIRNKLLSCIPPERIKNAYVPDIFGRERRKKTGSKEGKLGVEGMEAPVIEEALRRAGVTVSGVERPREDVTKADLYELGLSGGPDSAARRKELLKKLELPEHLSANALLEVLNVLYGREEFLKQAGIEESPENRDKNGVF